MGHFNFSGYNLMDKYNHYYVIGRHPNNVIKELIFILFNFCGNDDLFQKKC